MTDVPDWAQETPDWAQDTTPSNDQGATNAFARGVAQGATFNFQDEMRGLVEAGGTNPDEPASLSALAKGAYNYWTGNQEAIRRYDTAVARQRQLLEQSRSQHPAAETLGEITGGLAVPVGAGASGATMGARMARSALAGAGVGALSGAGSNEGTLNRLAGATTGAIGGAGVGAIAPPLVEGAVNAGTAALRPVVNTVRSAFNPEGEASRRVVTALQRDFANQGPQFTPHQATVAQTAGLPTAVIDAGGETTRALARSAANTSPEARQALTELTQDRFGSQNVRASAFVQRLTGGTGDNAATREDLLERARQLNRPAYQRAYQEGDRQIFTPGMEQLVGAPAVVSAMQRAAQSGRDRAITQGYGAFNPGVTVENGIVQFRRGPNGVPTYPNLAFWDATKRELDDAAGAAGRAGRNGEAGVLGDLARRLRGELDQQVPSYQAARAGAAQAFGAQDALEAGSNFVTSKMDNNEARRAVQRMNPAERQLFRQGYASTLINQIEEMGDRRTILNQIGQSPAARERMEIALGPPQARTLEAYLHAEGIMDRARTAVTGNSTTARQLTELGLAGGAYGITSHGDWTDPRAVAAGALVYGLTHGRNRIDENVARRVGQMLASNDPGVLHRGAQIVARSPRIMDNLRTIGDTLAARAAGRVGQKIGSSLVPMQGPVPAYANQKQP